jgi:hypothetical protein
MKIVNKLLKMLRKCTTMDLWFSSKRNQAIPSRAQINYTMLYYYSAGSLGLAYDKLTETTRITSTASALHHPHHITVAMPLPAL